MACQRGLFGLRASAASASTLTALPSGSTLTASALATLASRTAAGATESTAAAHHGSHVDFEGSAFHFFELCFLGVSEDSHGSFAGFLSGGFHFFAHCFEAIGGTGGTGCAGGTGPCALEGTAHVFHHFAHFFLGYGFGFLEFGDLVVVDFEFAFEIVGLEGLGET
jgi:hypothetical protein